MRRALWPDCEDHEAVELLERDSKEYTVLVAVRPNGGLEGFAEVGARPYAEGCSTSPVGYLEGIWVDADTRRRGVARCLVDQAMAWSADRGHREFASDCDIDNRGSRDFHLALGFEEAERIICFSRRIDP